MKAKEILKDNIISQIGDDLFEMANLRQDRTGIPGTIYISTQQSSHAARVKYFLDRPGRNMPSFSVSIGPKPEIIENSLPERVMNKRGKQVIEWVRLNHEKLTNFWINGTAWFDNEVEAFKASLVKLPSSQKKSK